MNYGLYLSATGIVTNTHRQDVIANNLANSQTSGFRRQLAIVMPRPPESQESGGRRLGDPKLDMIGGGQLMAPSAFDFGQGNLETTGGQLDIAADGEGFFGVQTRNGFHLTRNGQLTIDNEGFLALVGTDRARVTDRLQNPINLRGLEQADLQIQPDGTITYRNEVAGTVGMFAMRDTSQLRPVGDTLLKPFGDVQRIATNLIPATVERSNVDPAVELVRLLDAQRQLEANANMLRYQDQTLGRLVNDVGRIG